MTVMEESRIFTLISQLLMTPWARWLNAQRRIKKPKEERRS
jgi:hypothetical protein